VDQTLLPNLLYCSIRTQVRLTYVLRLRAQKLSPPAHQILYRPIQAPNASQIVAPVLYLMTATGCRMVYNSATLRLESYHVVRPQQQGLARVGCDDHMRGRVPDSSPNQYGHHYRIGGRPQ